MDEIEGMIKDISKIMDRLETERESIISISRKIIRKTKRVIHSIHLNEEYNLMELHKDVKELTAIINDSKSFTVHDAQDAMMEYAEVCILSAVLNGCSVPSFTDLGISPQSWVLGLADCLGEMRRSILDMILRNDIDDAKIIFKKMNGIYEELMLFDVPDAILPIRRKQDIARSVVERTRTDLANLR